MRTVGMGLILMTIRHKSPLFQAVEEGKNQTVNTDYIIIRQDRSRKPHRPESLGPECRILSRPGKIRLFGSLLGPLCNRRSVDRIDVCVGVEIVG
jgi:hypothetical protein